MEDEEVIVMLEIKGWMERRLVNLVVNLAERMTVTMAGGGTAGDGRRSTKQKAGRRGGGRGSETSSDGGGVRRRDEDKEATQEGEIY